MTTENGVKLNDILKYKQKFDTAVENKNLIKTEAGYFTREDIEEAGLVYREDIQTWAIPTETITCQEPIKGKHGNTLHERGEKIRVVSQRFLAWRDRKKQKQTAEAYEQRAIDALVRDFDGKIIS